MTHVYEKNLVVDGITPVGAYAALRRVSAAGSFLLESVEPGERWGRYSIVGVRPRRHIVIRPEPGLDLFARLGELIPKSADPDQHIARRLATAHVGSIAYDAVHYAFKVEPWPDARVPLARLVGESTLVVFDNLTHTASLASTDAGELELVERELSRVPSLAPIAVPNPGAVSADAAESMSDSDYGKLVQRVKEYIRAGDAFQVVLARTFSLEARGADAFAAYRALRVLSPAPYMYLLELPASDGLPALSVAGASPETLVRAQGSEVTLRPIAGTRRRGRDIDDDERLAAEMLADEKEVAEHVMLIDLARNDLGRICRPGSIRLPRRMSVERYSHVMHIVSEVAGQLGDADAWRVLEATFPAGTLTGAPKVRAMQIIRELEQRPRGVYGGAIGYVTASHDLDFAIAIRTLVLSEGRFEVTAGAGIVADSVPELEAKETRNKARAALAAARAASAPGE